ncbi:sigma-70 family RNA polymerase sigma factor [Actinoallomurus sp. CA-150999]|uniref:sigma-70 family RNA polymerase sigma factor n=1 Tax=Actinoallomurus sp. CA-150999 TaxID=3239887 RepID=UPI003D8C67FE
MTEHTLSLEDQVASGPAPDFSNAGSCDDLESFVRARPRLFAIAHQIVGNVHEAEDVVQEAWVRWQRVDRTTVINVEAFLVTATTRLAINLVQSARRRHETYVALGPNEEAAAPGADPLTEIERRETIELAARLLVEHFPPSERAAYVLREGFDYPYQQIARTLQIRPANARQLVKRARTRIAAGRRHACDSAAHRRFVRAFAAASLVGELTGLEALLVADLKRAGKGQPTCGVRGPWTGHSMKYAPGRGQAMSIGGASMCPTGSDQDQGEGPVSDAGRTATRG